MPIIASKRVKSVDVSQGVCAKMLFDFEHGNAQGIALAQGELRPGAQVFPHYHEVEEVAYITEGKGVIAVDGVETGAQAGGAILIPALPVHTVRNILTEGDLRVVSAFGPNNVKRFPVGSDTPAASYYQLTRNYWIRAGIQKNG